MILVFRKGAVYKANPASEGRNTVKPENIFPLMSLPLNVKGVATDLNDFQWWAYSDRWDKWLKANPREWTAESIDPAKYDYNTLKEELENRVRPISRYVSDQATNLITGEKAASFTEYMKIMEANEDEASGSKDALKKYIKLGYAVDSLRKSGKLKSTMSISSLEVGKQYAVVVDFMDETQKPVAESRQALRMTKIKETSKLVLAKVDYSIPTGKIEDEVDSFLDKVMDVTKSVAIAGVSLAAIYGVVQIAGSVWGGWQLFKTGNKIYNWATKKPAIEAAAKSGGGAWNAIKNFATTAWRGKNAASVVNAARTTLPSGAFVEGGLAYSAEGALLRGAASNSVKAAAGRVIAQNGGAAVAAAGAEAAGASGIVAAEASNPIGWIIAAVSIIGSGVNQIWNWMSDKQAPRYSDIDSFAYGSFSPKDIPVGKPITVCWTSDGGGGGWGFVADLLTFSKDDTRTTMELVKIGSFKDRSIFMLTQVNSKGLQKMMKDNDLILLSFDNGDKFERGTFDNDDLEFETIAVQDITKLTIGTSFVGYSGWDDMQSAYNEAPDSAFYVPGGARQEYPFNYENASGKKVNVTGTLVSRDELENMDISRIIPIPGEGVLAESKSVVYLNSLNENKSVLSFEEFFSNSNSIITEADKESEAEAEESNDDAEMNDWSREFTERKQASSYKSTSNYGQIPMAVYKVNNLQYVDPNESGKAGDFSYYIVDPDSLDAQPGQAIGVESASTEDAINDPRFGLETYIEPEVETTEESPEEEVVIEPVEDEPGEIISTSKGDVNIRKGKNSLTIKDRETTGGVNVLDQFGTEELKKDLAINNWDGVTSVKLRYDRIGEPLSVIVKNRGASTGDRRRVIRRGELGFDDAVKFAKDIEAGIKTI